MQEELEQQLAFIHEIDKLKYIQRKTALFNSSRPENDAEHSWHLAMMALVFAGHSNVPVDLFKVIRMLLIHDVVEIDSGDIFLFDAAVDHDNTEQERHAAQRIFGMLPPAQAAEMLALWEEFEAGETPEAQFARAMDRLEPVLQNLSNAGGTWKEKNVAYEKVIQRVSVIGKGSEKIWTSVKQRIDESAARGMIRKEET